MKTTLNLCSPTFLYLKGEEYDPLAARASAGAPAKLGPKVAAPPKSTMAPKRKAGLTIYLVSRIFQIIFQ